MQNHKKHGTSLSQAVDRIVRESIKQALYQNTLDEKERQQALSEEDDDLFGDEEGGSDDEKKKEKEDTKSSKTMSDEKEKLKSGDVETSDIVDKLNAIRSGRSFKSDDIAKKLDEYISSLKKAEKVALLAFLKGLSQIVTGEIPAEDAMEPADPEPDVEMKKGASKQQKTIKPNVIKAPPKEKEEKEKPSAEDTSGPVPITPKKK